MIWYSWYFNYSNGYRWKVKLPEVHHVEHVGSREQIKKIRPTKFSPEHIIYFQNMITDIKDVMMDWKYNSYGRNKKCKIFPEKNYLENLQGDEKLTLKLILGNSLWGWYLDWTSSYPMQGFRISNADSSIFATRQHDQITWAQIQRKILAISIPNVCHSE